MQETSSEKVLKSKVLLMQICDLVFGLMDFIAAMLLFLPLFADRGADFVNAISIIRLLEAPSYVSVTALIMISLTAIMGVITLSLQTAESHLWLKIKRPVSLFLSGTTLLWLIISLQPYAAIFVFALLAVKLLFLFKSV